MTMSDQMNAIARAMSLAGGRGEPALTVSELADLAGLSPSAAYRAVKALERRGEVEKAGIALNGGQCWKVAG